MKKVVIITGATSGIGLATAKLFTEKDLPFTGLHVKNMPATVFTAIPQTLPITQLWKAFLKTYTKRKNAST